MATIRKSERKPLSFSTTMRNPSRIAGFLNCIIPFEGKVLTNEVIHEVAVNLISKKLYYTQKYEMKVPEYRAIFKDENAEFTREQVEDIIKNSPQQHKEAGFEKGWPSRFDTWYKLSMEFGFITYKIGQPIKISQTGHMLVDAYNESPVNEKKVQNVMLNSMMKYQSDNPFRRNLNSNVPLVLLLNLLKKLKSDPEENGAGVFRKELSLLICWQNDDVEALYDKIKSIRREVGYNYSDEYMYEICLQLLEVGDDKRKRFKMNQICGEAIDEYIRKMRSTGVISLRGNGRFIDFNTFEQEKIDYIIRNYSTYESYSNVETYYEYMGIIDNNILDIRENVKINILDIKKATLHKYAKKYSKEQIFDELVRVCNKKDSKDPMLKFINAPTRLEFLTSIALVQGFESLDVNPNYAIDDEGLPTFTAGGGMADIECFDTLCDSFFEVTLMCGRQDQVNNEIVPIRRHLKEHQNQPQTQNRRMFSVFIAPVIHEDTREVAMLYKIRENLDIMTYNIREFIEKMETSIQVTEFLSN
ncbi:MAG: AlwI family type II restriction endonuclease [Bacillota bacterium]|nr:AlwI family type II restriction endonuclease [Bacillota bacterium]